MQKLRENLSFFVCTKIECLFIICLTNVLSKIYNCLQQGVATLKVIRIILQIAVLYVFCFIGTVIVDFLHIPLPGSIIGLILLLIGLLTKVIPDWFVKEGAGFLLSILTLLFIPATVGIMNYPELLSGYGVLLVVIVLISTLFTLVLTGKIARRMEGEHDRT